MSDPLPPKFTRVALLIAAVIACAAAVHAQDNPYRVAEGWPQLPSAMKFGGVISTDVDARGDIFVSDGHVMNANGRIVKFSKDGKFIKTWGKKGKGPGEMDTPHAIAMDSRGRLFVADRANNRIQIFDQDGKFLDQWKQFGRPSGVSIDKNDTVYVVDSQSNASLNPGFKIGLRVGSAKDGKVTALVPFVEPEPDKNNNAGMEGVAADAMGNIYVGETTTQILKKYVRAARSN